MPLAPTSMLRTKSSCPGTLIIPTVPTSSSCERRKAEIDRYSAPLFLGQAISVDARQRLHQRSLSVIDVSRRADDQAALQRSCSHTANARSGRSSLRWAPRNSRSSR